jgi:gliding motility-associated-like protein
MQLRLPFILVLLLTGFTESAAQCSTTISSFPYREGFETSAGGWNSGGVGNDWAWGTPAKPVISSAGGGTRCWVIGGLTASSYTNGEASWLQSPCFDFSGLDNPYIEFKVFWEMEQRFDGAGFEYSTDNGSTWSSVGSATDAINCLNTNWFNNNSITYLAPLSATRNGWSGNIQPGSGSCNGGSGSNGWVTAKHTMPYLGGTAAVIFRFIFGAGTICNNYDGFAVDDILINEAPPNAAAFTYACAANRVVNFTNSSAGCPTGFSWNFGDPASGTNNTATIANPTHVFSATGEYTVSLTVSGPGNTPSTTSQQVTVIELTSTVINPADCLTGKGGSASVGVTGAPGPFSYLWNTSPVQRTATAVDLTATTYSVTVSATGICPVTTNVTIPVDLSCIGIYFPTGFTPNNDGKNDSFGPLGSLSLLSNYKLSVYNRWGERVFYSVNPLEKWNGRVRGFETDMNIFAWFAEFSLQGNPKQLKKGTVTLIR